MQLTSIKALKGSQASVLALCVRTSFQAPTGQVPRAYESTASASHPTLLPPSLPPQHGSPALPSTSSAEKTGASSSAKPKKPRLGGRKKKTSLVEVRSSKEVRDAFTKVLQSKGMFYEPLRSPEFHEMVTRPLMDEPGFTKAVYKVKDHLIERGATHDDIVALTTRVAKMKRAARVGKLPDGRTAEGKRAREGLNLSVKATPAQAVKPAQKRNTKAPESSGVAAGPTTMLGEAHVIEHHAHSTLPAPAHDQHSAEPNSP